MTDTLVGKIVAIHQSLDTADIAHAFGGALALAFCTEEPRTTNDIDLNVFAGPDHTDAVLSTLPGGVTASEAARNGLRRDGQARLWWDTTPVDVFLSNHPFHDHAEANRRVVPFAGVDLPVLACADLAVFKAFFARPKDAVDLAAMAAAGCVTIDEVQVTVERLLGGPEDRATFFERTRENLDGVRRRDR